MKETPFIIKIIASLTVLCTFAAAQQSNSSGYSNSTTQKTVQDKINLTKEKIIQHGGKVTTTPLKDNIKPEHAEGSKFFNTNNKVFEGATNEENQLPQTNATLFPADKHGNILQNDNLPQSNISQGKQQKVNMGGDTTGKTITTSSGTRLYVHKNSTGESVQNAIDIDYFDNEDLTNPNSNETSLGQYYKKYKDFVQDDNKTRKIQNEQEARTTAKEYSEKRNNTINEMSERFIGKESILSGGQTIAASFRKVVHTNLTTDSQQIIELEKNATNLYNKKFSTSPNAASNTELIQENFGVLTTAYNKLDDITANITSRINSPKMQCQISRELIPSYYCPLQGKNAIRFPSAGANSDLRKVNIVEAKKECNNFCKTDVAENKCIADNKIASTIIKLSGDIDYIKSLFKTFQEDEQVVTKKNIYNKIPISEIVLSFSISKGANTTLTDEEWEKQLSNSSLKMKYSISTTENITNLAPVDLISKETLSIKSSKMKITIPIHKQTNILNFIFYRPFVSSNLFYQHKQEPILQHFRDLGIEVALDDIEIHHESKGYHYCPAKQIVRTPTECSGGRTIKIRTGSSQMGYVCLAPEKKIGPEIETGAFFSADTCDKACVVSTPCQTTYTHYSGYDDINYKYQAKIGCVDSPDNSACTDEICEALFKDTENRPINEAVIANDDQIRFTVRNNVIQQNVMRPKIDIDAELGLNPDYKEVFQSEQKDAAYEYMIKNVSYNRIKYRVGTPSPVKLAYEKSLTPDKKTRFSVILKEHSYLASEPHDYYYVVRLEQVYKPKFGTFYIKKNGSNLVTTEKGGIDIQFKDYVYMYKNGRLEDRDVENAWEVFRIEEYAENLQQGTRTTMDSEGTVYTKEYSEWIKDSGQNVIKSWVYFDPSNNYTKKARSPSSSLHASIYDRFSPQSISQRYTISNDLLKDIFGAHGALIKDQDASNNETAIVKVYDEERPVSALWKGNPVDYTVYFVGVNAKGDTRSRKTSIELMRAIEGNDFEDIHKKVPPQDNIWGVYNLYSPQLFRSTDVQDDGELNNENVRVFVQGKPEQSTIHMQTKPALSEKGKKVFYFLFLYDDENKF